jgi:hypothetical protein
MKRNNLKFGLILLITVLTTIVRSQSPIMSYITDINTAMSSIPLVFEGRVVSVEVFAGDKNGNPLGTGALSYNGDIGYWYLPNGNRGYGYSRAKIKVCKIYKGEIRLDEDHCFEVLTRAHSLTNIFMDKSDASNIHQEFTNISATHLDAHEEEVILPHTNYPTKLYLCDKLDPIGATNYAVDEYYVSNFHVKYDAPMFVQVEVMGTNGIATMQTAFCQLFGQNIFKDQAEYQTFLAAIGLNPTPTSFCDWDFEHGGKSAPTIEEAPKRNYEDNVRNYEEMMKPIEIAMKRTAAEKQGRRSSSTVDFFADIINERMVQVGGNPWFEFDIQFSQNTAGKYFNNFLLRLSYNSAAFGTNVATNNNIVVTAAAPFQIATYVNPNSVVNDYTPTIVNVPIGLTTNTSTPLSRILAPTSPQIILTVRMKIQSCNMPASITYTDDFVTSFISQYALTANAVPTLAVSYDNGTYTGNITDNTCMPIITSWSNGVPGGLRRVASVTGKYFGNVKGNGSVIFRNSDQGKAYPLQQGTNWGGLQAYDIISWTDTQINFRMPSYIDSAWVMNGSTPIMAPDGITPGTGKFMVKNFSGQYTQSSSDIYIPYCIYNIRYYNAPTYAKYTVRLSSPNGTGYKMQNDPALTAFDPDEKPVFYRAMNDWMCPTWINWKLGPDTTMTFSETDTKCQIVLSSTLSPLARTRLLAGVCSPDANGNRKAFLEAFDMQIRQTPPAGPWQVDTTGFLFAGYTDFYHCVAHELGHAHLVNHISDSTNNLMWWRNYVYSFNLTNRFKVWYSFDAEYAGEYVTDSLVGGLQCVPNHVTVSGKNCEGYSPTGIKNQIINLDNITVFPNPSAVSQDITIKFDFDKPQKVKLSLYSITGSLIRYTDTETIMKEDFNFNASTLEQGMYMLQIDAGGKKQAFKIIKE